jgi:phospholipase/lecithinase/hemolysin
MLYKIDVNTELDWFSGDCTLAERDSYMWWDELHPSEQMGRKLAAEVLKKINGKSKY